MEQYPSGQPRSPAGDRRAVVVAPRVALSVAFVYHDLRGRGLPKGSAADALCIYFFNSKLRVETKALTHGLVHFSWSLNNF